MQERNNDSLQSSQETRRRISIASKAGVVSIMESPIVALGGINYENPYLMALAIAASFLTFTCIERVCYLKNRLFLRNLDM